MRAVIDFDDDRLFARHRRPVHVALRIAVERTGGQGYPGLGIFVTPLQAEHELIRRGIMRRGNSRALGEFDQRDRSSGLFVAPKHFLRHALQRLLAPGQAVGLDQDFLEARHGHHGTNSPLRPWLRPANLSLQKFERTIIPYGAVLDKPAAASEKISRLVLRLLERHYHGPCVNAPSLAGKDTVNEGGDLMIESKNLMLSGVIACILAASASAQEIKLTFADQNSPSGWGPSHALPPWVKQ